MPVNCSVRRFLSSAGRCLFRVVIAIGCMSSVVDCSGLPVVIMAMMAMLYTGTMDDILSLSPGLRFVIEIVVVLLLIFVGGYCIDDFHGLWNIGRFFLLVCSAFDGRCGGRYYQCHQLGRWRQRSLVRLLHYGMSDLRHALLSCRRSADDYLGRSLGRRPDSLFLHNVFGKTSKMFIGDGGTLVMGVVMSVFVIAILQNGSRVAAYVNPNVGLVPFTLAVLSVPVFDTLRVMSTRILKGTSPFRPDKTHLHHMFIDLGCSHVATTLAILGGEYVCRVVLVGAGSFGLDRRPAVCGHCRKPAGHFRSLPFHAVAYLPRYAIHEGRCGGWATKPISAVREFSSGCSR